MGAAAKRVVLIVEDDRDARELLAEIICREGVEAVMAENGQDGIEKLKACAVKPSLIFMDLQMPVADGYEFRRDQCADPEMASIPTVVVSANFDRCDHARLGNVELLPKPVQLERIDEIVRRYCESA